MAGVSTVVKWLSNWATKHNVKAHVKLFVRKAIEEWSKNQVQDMAFNAVGVAAQRALKGFLKKGAFENKWSPRKTNLFFKQNNLLQAIDDFLGGDDGLAYLQLLELCVLTPLNLAALSIEVRLDLACAALAHAKTLMGQEKVRILGGGTAKTVFTMIVDSADKVLFTGITWTHAVRWETVRKELEVWIMNEAMRLEDKEKKQERKSKGRPTSPRRSLKDLQGERAKLREQLTNIQRGAGHNFAGTSSRAKGWIIERRLYTDRKRAEGAVRHRLGTVENDIRRADHEAILEQKRRAEKELKDAKIREAAKEALRNRQRQVRAKRPRSLKDLARRPGPGVPAAVQPPLPAVKPRKRPRPKSRVRPRTARGRISSVPRAEDLAAPDALPRMFLRIRGALQGEMLPHADGTEAGAGKAEIELISCQRLLATDPLDGDTHDDGLQCVFTYNGAYVLLQNALLTTEALEVHVDFRRPTARKQEVHSIRMRDAHVAAIALSAMFESHMVVTLQVTGPEVAETHERSGATAVVEAPSFG